MPQNVSGSLYVDDLILYSSPAHVLSVECRFQIAINRVYSWAEDHEFEFCNYKTVAVHFHCKSRLQQEPSLSLNCHRIIFKTSIKFLGLIFDQRLNWKLHIDHLKTVPEKNESSLMYISKAVGS